MAYRFEDERKSWPRRLVPLSLLCALGLIALAVIFIKPGRALMPAFAAPKILPARGWRVVVGSDPAGKSGQRLGGYLLPGSLLYVPAGAVFRIVADPPQATGAFMERSRGGGWDHEGGEINPGVQTPEGWEHDCRAPRQPGLYQLDFHQPPEAGGVLALNVLVCSQAELQTRGGKTAVAVNGKSIGSFGDPAQSSVRRVREAAALYQPPRFFALLTPETIPIRLGDGLELGQLVAFKDHYGPDGKKVISSERHASILPPRPDLIDKLVKLRERLRARGVRMTRFWITSGFRTPDYNRSIGGAAFSRHCYGDAVDLCIDEDRDLHMDDLNGDGRIDRKDGIVIAEACRELEAEGAVAPGGIGVYEWDGEESVRSHVHVDCRGYVSRWGQSGSGRHKKSFVWWPKSEFQDDDGGD